MMDISIDYIETGDIIIPAKTVTKIPVKRFGISKVVVVRTKGNGRL